MFKFLLIAGAQAKFLTGQATSAVQLRMDNQTQCPVFSKITAAKAHAVTVIQNKSHKSIGSCECGPWKCEEGALCMKSGDSKVCKRVTNSPVKPIEDNCTTVKPYCGTPISQCSILNEIKNITTTYLTKGMESCMWKVCENEQECFALRGQIGNKNSDLTFKQESELQTLWDKGLSPNFPRVGKSERCYEYPNFKVQNARESCKLWLDPSQFNGGMPDIPESDNTRMKDISEKYRNIGAQGMYYSTEEFIAGGTLETGLQKIKDSEQYGAGLETDSYAKGVLFQILHALHALQHQFSQVHSDLHTSNIMLQKTNERAFYYKYEDKYYEIPCIVGNGHYYYVKLIDVGHLVEESAYVAQNFDNARLSQVLSALDLDNLITDPHEFTLESQKDIFQHFEVDVKKIKGNVWGTKTDNSFLSISLPFAIPETK